MDFIEQKFTCREHLKAYFMPFKEAAAKKKAEEADLNEKGNKDKTKGLTPAQAHLFCEALLDIRNCTYSNKKDTISPLASALFGWAVSTMERNLAYTADDRKHVAELFKNVDPEFSKHVRNFGNKCANHHSEGDSEQNAR